MADIGRLRVEHYAAQRIVVCVQRTSKIFGLQQPYGSSGKEEYLGSKGSIRGPCIRGEIFSASFSEENSVKVKLNALSAKFSEFYKVSYLGGESQSPISKVLKRLHK